MTTLASETVLSVHHWNDTLFSFRTTRSAGLRFINGQFVMMGLEVEGRRNCTPRWAACPDSVQKRSSGRASPPDK